jgi:luciferase family oxidoreductase group 1
MSNVNLSVLDLCPVISGESAAKALQDTLQLAAFVEALGAKRYWIAEHHSMAGIASASPEIIIGHVAQATKRMRVGSGGIMLPNHAPLRIAEAFRTLEAFHPGRIDLGVGRAPGTNTTTTMALRGGSDRLRAENFPQELTELQAYLSSRFKESPYEQVVAMPVIQSSPEVWMLGSSDFGARLAAERGLPYAFAQHFSPLPAAGVLKLYRDHFRPSPTLSEPKAVVAVHMVCGSTDEEARKLALPSDIAFYRYRTTGRNIPLPTFAEAKESPLTLTERERLKTMSIPKFVGSPETLRKELSEFLKQTEVTELMVLTMIPDLSERQKSYQRTAEILAS